MRQIQKKGLVRIFSNEPPGGLAKTIGEVQVIGGVVKARYPVRGIHALLPVRAGRHAFAEAPAGRQRLVLAQVPLADADRGVSDFSQPCGECWRRGGQPVAALRRLQLGVGHVSARNVVRNVERRGRMAREDGGAGGRAIWCRRVRVREARALLGQPVEHRRVVELVAVAA